MIAVYAGTFDPPTEGHLSVIRRAAALFDHLVVLVAVNPAKHPLFSEAERVELLRAELADFPNVRVASTEGYVAHFARHIGARVLVRGVRGAMDAESETALAQANAQLVPEVETVWLPASAALSDVSSSELKRRVREGGDISTYCSPRIEAALREKLPPPPEVSR